MKKFLNKVANKFNHAAVAVQSTIANKKAEGYVDSGVKILIAVVKQVAVSFTIDNFAAGLSGKLENGDIISVIVTDKENKKTFIPSALTYVRVITTTTGGGVDKEAVKPNDDGTYSLPETVTVLVTTEQAKIIAGYEDTTTMQTALVFRGDKETAQKFLDKQTEYLAKGVSENE